MIKENDALLLTAALKHQKSGNLDAALRLYDQLISANPRVVELHSNRGGILQALGRLTEALNAFEFAARVAPGDPVTHFNLGNAYSALGRISAAVEAFDQAIILDPKFAEARLNRGIALKNLGRVMDALAAYDQALAIRPDLYLALYNRGVLLQEVGRYKEALDAYGSAIEINPCHAKAHNNRGNILRMLGRDAEAYQAFHQALEIDKNYVEALCNLGNLLRSQGNFKQALKYLDLAVNLKADFAEAHLNRGATLQEKGFLHGALQACDRALEVDPDSIAAHLNRAGILKDLGRSMEARQEYRRIIHQRPDLAVAHSNRLFSLHYWEENAGGEILRAAKAFGHQFDGAYRFAGSKKGKRPDQKLRLGYVSADFRRHSVGFFLQQVFLHHNQEQFEVYAYNNGDVRDDLTVLLSSKVTEWRDIYGVSDQIVADRIQRDGIDVLVDLSGHSAGNRLPLFGLRPAPVQVSWLGYFGTTGLATMDYVVGDQFVTPVGCENEFVETIYRLPNCYLCYNPPRLELSTERAGSDNGGITFASFNNVAKISEATIRLWAEVLNAVPVSRLILRDKSFAELSMRKLLLKRFGVYDLAPERLDLLPAVERKDYLQCYQSVDIALDPTPYGGGTTTADALWMGVPVVTLTGNTWAGRISTSILMSIGASEFVSGSEATFILNSVSLAANKTKRTWLREHLRQKLIQSPFCDGKGFTRELEDGFQSMYQAYTRCA